MDTPSSNPQVLFLNRILKILEYLLINQRILFGTGYINLTQAPYHLRPLTSDELTWRTLESATDLAYQHALRTWGPQFCQTISLWLSDVRYIYLFDNTRTTKGRDCTGMTFLDGPPVIHLALREIYGPPLSLHTIAATLLHEIMHLRERYPDLPNLSVLIQQIHAMLRKYQRQGRLDPETARILSLPTYETIPWITELGTIGTLRLPFQRWGVQYKDVLNLILSRKTQIAPPHLF